jgi:hypothetical protein
MVHKGPPRLGIVSSRFHSSLCFYWYMHALTVSIKRTKGPFLRNPPPEMHKPMNPFPLEIAPIELATQSIHPHLPQRPERLRQGQTWEIVQNARACRPCSCLVPQLTLLPFAPPPLC